MVLNANPKTTNAPTFNLTSIKGKKIDITVLDNGFNFSTLKGKNVITLFYIYSGKPCRDELKVFSKLKKGYADTEFVTFELKGLTLEKFDAFEKELNIEGLHMIDSKQAISFAKHVASLIKWQGSVPLLIITNKKGTVKHMQLGAMSEKEITDMLSKI